MSKINTLHVRFPNGLEKALTLSYDDGVEEDIRLIEIMEAHGLRGTFNLNTGLYPDEDFQYPPEKTYGRRLTKQQATALYSRDGIEVALHAHTHPDLTTSPLPQLTYEIACNRAELEQQFGKIVRGMAYPYGPHKENALSVLKHCGIQYSRTVQATYAFEIPQDPLEFHPTCHHKKPQLDELTHRFLNDAPKIGKDPWLFTLWGHTYEFAKDDNWEIIEKFAARVSGRSDVWYATNGEVFDYLECFHALIFSMDMTRVYNPTAQTVWFTLRDQLFEVGAGKTLSLT